MPRADSPSARRAALLALAFGLVASPTWAADAKQPVTPLDQKEFFRPELSITSSHVPLEDAMGRLPNRAAWQRFALGEFAGWLDPQGVEVWIDPRSGAATNILGAYPLIPGDGIGNRLAAGGAVDAAHVERAALAFVRRHAELLGIDVAQLGEARVTQVNPDLWQVYVPQTYGGLPVRHGHLVATISHGNLVTVGVDTWGNVSGLDTTPLVPAEAALQAGFAYAEGPGPEDVLLEPARLEVIPFDPQPRDGGAFAGIAGQGYGHRLVWTFVFQRPPEDARWEVMVDARDGEVIALQDVNHYVQRQVTGGVYPVTSTEVCPTPLKCGTMQSNWPMPFANTGLASPNNFANSAGVFDWTSGTVTTTLSGRYVRISDACGSISASSSTGSINLGGTNGQHDCSTPGSGGAGNTAAARSAFYEVNKIEEMARGWLPNNTWLTGSSVLTANVNINNTCNGFWNGSTINFYRSGGGCRNTGELAGVFDHEWGHGMDDNDANGVISNSGEGYADIAAIYRYQDSCVGHGFFLPPAGSCGLTADGTGRNTDEDQTAGVHCVTDCSGVRDADYGKHADGLPDTALGHVCTRCNSGTGPCGRQVHCAAAPQRQAAWDLVARDLTASPFSYDSQTAFIAGNRLFYQGSGNIGTWYACTCGSSSSACGSTNGYMQWLAADDDNGNVNDGTPHMTAIYNAFNRHGIACSTPARVNSGCSGQPNGTTGPTLTATPGNYQVALSWTAVSGASRYWVFRTEGHAGCNYGKARIADITGTSFTDTQVANGRAYSYNVVAQGSSSSCYSRASTCVSATPNGTATPDFTVSCPASASVTQGSSTAVTCSVTSTGGFNSSVDLSCTNPSSGVSCSFSPDPVTPPAGGSANSTLTISASSGATTGTFNLNVQGVGGSLTRSDGISLTVNPAGGGGTVFFDDFETDRGWARNPLGTDTATTGLWERANPETTTSSGTKQQGTTVSGVNDLVTGPLAGSSAGVHDIDGGVTTIQSPAIALPSSGTLTLSFSYYLAHGTNSSSADFLRVFVVGGTTTQVFQELGAANDDDAVWASTNVNISSFAGQTVRIRIQAADASGASLVEAAVDDVRITQQ
jgi:hypothetical protein